MEAPPEDNAPSPEPPAALPPPPSSRSRRWGKWLAQRAVELSTVFVGVYAAFLLNNHASHRQERQRREQMLTWLDDNYTQVLHNAQEQIPRLRQRGAEFNRRLAAGEMPEIKPFNWQSDYDATDSTSVLQSGGYDLLDIATIRDIRDVESSLRAMVSHVKHLEQVGDALIRPNLGKGSAVFYDPATRELREPYAWYPKFFGDEAEFFEDLEPKVTRLLAQVRAERERER